MNRRIACLTSIFAALGLGGACADADRTTSPVGASSTGGSSSASSTATTSGAGTGGAESVPEAPFEPGEERPGGATTVALRDATSFLLPISNLSPQRRGTFEAGLALFSVAWTTGGEADRDGLGPTYVATSCRACHFRGGRGAPPPPGEPMTSMLIRLSVPSGDGSSLGADPRYGDQIQTKAVPGVAAEGWFSVEYTPRSDAYLDGGRYTLLTPRYTAHDLALGPLPEGTRLSPRVAQPMVGLGLLAAIRDKDIEALADPDDADGDGIRGRRNLTVDVHGNPMPGRFGWKANQPDLETQTAAAFLGDIGITSPFYPVENCPQTQKACAASAGATPDIDADRLAAVVFFSYLIAVPHRPEAAEPSVLRGKALFAHAGCDRCHRPSFVTGELPGYPELEGQHIYPYTDLLIHDMGPDLADGRPDHEAGARDFRTPPLWGIGLTNVVSMHTRLLHDGRARNIEEAILWHGGEAEPARDVFRGLSAEDREALLRFVASL